MQREITSWQTELETIDGRLRFISQSANFSKLQVTVNLSPIPMQVDAGSDIRVGLSTQRQYTARFNPPAGYDTYEIIWDFGDGTPPRSANSALRTQNEEGLLSVPVVHSYSSDGFSPYVVTVNIKAYSENGVAEGEDKILGPRRAGLVRGRCWWRHRCWCPRAKPVHRAVQPAGGVRQLRDHLGFR